MSCCERLRRHWPIHERGTSVRKKRILLADDDQAFLMALAIRLKSRNLGVITANSGSDALKKAIRHRPDAIITDINMPCGDGFTIQSHIASLGWGPPPIIFVTGEKPGGMEMRLWQSNARDVLYKPLDIHELVRTLEDVLAAA
jgi:two-component system, OmpR family, KDP operon response regulator KdpE